MNSKQRVHPIREGCSSPPHHARDEEARGDHSHRSGDDGASNISFSRGILQILQFQNRICHLAASITNSFWGANSPPPFDKPKNVIITC